MLTFKEPMKDASEDEQEDYFITEHKIGSKQGKSHSERAAELRKMMDEEGKTNPDMLFTSERELIEGKTKKWKTLPTSLLKNRLL